jgi:hypothetical protein
MQPCVIVVFSIAAFTALVGCKPTSLDPDMRDRLVGMWTDDHGSILQFRHDGNYGGRISNGALMKGEYFATRSKLRLKELEAGEALAMSLTERIMPFTMKIDTFELKWMGKPWVFRRMRDDE